MIQAFPVKQLDEPPIEPGDGIRFVGLTAAGIVAISGHVGLGLALLGPGAILPTIALGVAVGCFLLALPSGSGGGSALVPVLVGLVLAMPGFLLIDNSEVASEKLSGIVEILIPLCVTVAFLTRRPSDLNYFWRGVFGLAAFGVLVVAAEIAAGVDIGMRGSDAQGALNPIAAGRLGATVVIWIMFGGATKLPKIMRIGLTIAGAAVLLGAASRGPLLALIVAVFLSGIRYRVLRGRLAAVVTIATLAVMAGLGNAVLAESGERILSNTGETGSTSRSALWGEAIHNIKIWPEGIGFGQFAESGKIGSLADYPHNLILELALEAGVLAAFVFVLGIGYVGKRVWSSTATCGARHFALLTFWAFTSMFSSDINGNRVLIIALFGLIAAYRRPMGDDIDDEQAGGTHVVQTAEVRV